MPECASCVERMVETHIPWADGIARSIHRRLPPSFDQDDLMQAARIGVWKAAAQYDAGRGVPFLAWAHPFVQGECWMLVRRRNYTESTHADLSEARTPITEPDIGAQIDRRSQTERVLAASRRLPRKLRSVIVLHYQLGWPMRSVARSFHMSLTSAYGLRKAALEAIRADREFRLCTGGGVGAVGTGRPG